MKLRPAVQVTYDHLTSLCSKLVRASLTSSSCSSSWSLPELLREVSLLRTVLYSSGLHWTVIRELSNGGGAERVQHLSSSF